MRAPQPTPTPNGPWIWSALATFGRDPTPIPFDLIERLTGAWGDELVPLYHYLEAVTQPWRAVAPQFARTLEDSDNTGAKVLIVAGERCHTQAELDNPHMSETLLAVAHAVMICQNAGLDFHILFTGGHLGNEFGYNERCGTELDEAFLRLTRERHLGLSSVDSLSQHTGHQARHVANLVHLHTFTRLVLVSSIDHIGRFGATIAQAVIERSHLGRLGSEFPLRLRPGLVPVLHFFGTCDQELGWRTPTRLGLTMAEEAFGPVMPKNHPRLLNPKRQLGGEYVERYSGGVDNTEHVCANVAPTGMCQLLGIDLPEDTPNERPRMADLP